MREIVFAGAGGQGVLTSGLIMSEILVSKGYNATWMPQYGSAMRGGDADCTVKFSEGMVYNPSQEEPEIVLAMNTTSFNKFLPMVKAGGTVVLNTDMVDPELNTRDDIKIVEVPCMKMAEELRHPLGANIIMTGVIAKLLGSLTEEEAVGGMNDMFRRDGKERFEESNTAAFKLGYNFI